MNIPQDENDDYRENQNSQFGHQGQRIDSSNPFAIAVEEDRHDLKN